MPLFLPLGPPLSGPPPQWGPLWGPEGSRPAPCTRSGTARSLGAREGWACWLAPGLAGWAGLLKLDLA